MPPEYIKEINQVFAHPLTHDDAGAHLPIDMTYTGPKSKKLTTEEIQRDFVSQVGRDWMRNAGITYFISGVSALVLNGYKKADTASKVADLFKRTLLRGLPLSQHDIFFRLLIPHIHQGGLMHHAARSLSEQYCKDVVGVPGHQKLFFHGDTFLYPIDNGIGIIERNRLTRVLTTKEDGMDIDQETVGTKDQSPVEVTTYTSIRFLPPDGLSIAPIQTQINIVEPRFKDLLGLKLEEPDLFAMGTQVASDMFYGSSKVAMNLGMGFGTWLGVVKEPTKEVKEAVGEMQQSIKALLTVLSADLRRSVEEGHAHHTKTKTIVECVKEQFEKVIEFRSLIPTQMIQVDEQLEVISELKTQYDAEQASLTARKERWEEEQRRMLHKAEKVGEDVNEKLTHLKELLVAIQQSYSELTEGEQRTISSNYNAAIKEIEQKQWALIAFRERVETQIQALPTGEAVAQHITVFRESVLQKLTHIEDYVSQLKERYLWLESINRECGMTEVLTLRMHLGECELLLQQDKIALALHEEESGEQFSQIERLMAELQDVNSVEEIEKKQGQLQQFKQDSLELQKRISSINYHIIALNQDIAHITQQLEESQKPHHLIEQHIPRIKETVDIPEEAFSILRESKELETRLSLNAIKSDQTSVTPSAILESMRMIKEQRKGKDLGSNTTM